MKTFLILAIALMIVATGFAQYTAKGSQTGVKRTDLQKSDLSISGREVVQVRVDIAPGVTAARHSHHGEEIVYAIEGTMEYRLDGKPPVTIKAGEVLTIPYGVVHEVKNVGEGNAAELATYIVEKGKPLVVPAK